MLNIVIIARFDSVSNDQISRVIHHVFESHFSFMHLIHVEFLSVRAQNDLFVSFNNGVRLERRPTIHLDKLRLCLGRRLLIKISFLSYVFVYVHVSV